MDVENEVVELRERVAQIESFTGLKNDNGLKSRVDDLTKKTDENAKFRWMVIGGAVIFSTFASYFISTVANAV